MSIKALFIFTAIVTILFVGVTLVGWLYFLKWARDEKKVRDEIIGRSREKPKG